MNIFRNCNKFSEIHRKHMSIHNNMIIRAKMIQLGFANVTIETYTKQGQNCLIIFSILEKKTVYYIHFEFLI